MTYAARMNQVRPDGAYEFLTPQERVIVDEYVFYAVEEQHRLRERIIHALYKPIPTEYVRRSKGVLNKPVVLAAVTERLKHFAGEQDISPDKVIAEHATLAFSDIYSYYVSDSFGQMSPVPKEMLTQEQRRAVKSIEVKPGMYGMSHKITLHDKQQSLKFMAEVMGLVAPDRPPALLEYVKPVKTQEFLTSETSETLYAELLEH